ncbi:hypothetical protein NL676_009724 [Syzygium grande]|nr:hypothetical protein NL676_009724 [Syzygium grande]
MAAVGFKPILGYVFNNLKVLFARALLSHHPEHSSAKVAVNERPGVGRSESRAGRAHPKLSTVSLEHRGAAESPAMSQPRDGGGSSVVRATAGRAVRREGREEVNSTR